MLIITIIRWAIFVTFLIVVAEGIAGIIFVPRFYALYVTQHVALEKRLEALERRVKILEQV